VKQLPYVDLRIINAHILIGDKIVDGGVSINGGKIAKVGKEPNLQPAEITLDAEGMLLLPGAIDAHVHLRDFELSYKEDIISGTCAAAHGGVTTVLDMPNTKPPLTTPGRVRKRIDLIKRKALVNVGIFAGFPRDLSSIHEFATMGVVGIKVYLNHPLEGEDIGNLEVIKALFSHAALCGILIAVHPEDFIILEKNSEKYSDISDDLERFLLVHSKDAEISAIKKCVKICAKTGVHLHFCHVSSAEGITEIKRVKDKIRVSAEVTPHHLFLNKKAYEKWGAIAKTVPPLRDKRDNIELLRAIASKIADIIASDHAPHTLEEKNLPFEEAAAGIPSLDIFYPLILTYCEKLGLSYVKVIDSVTRRPAKIFGLSNKGIIGSGYDADIVLLDKNAERRVRPENFFSKAKYSPFEGSILRWIPKVTIVNGKIVFEGEDIVGSPGTGAYCRCYRQ